METADPIIVIGRTFGAGGRAIGKIIASELAIPYYDNEILKEASKEFGFSSSIFARVDEKKPSLFKRLLTQSYGVQESFGPDALSTETLYQAQSKVIKSIASKGACLIVGRTADYILRDQKNLCSIFLHAPIDFRARKIMERGDAASLDEARELARRRDKEREAYYNYFTGRHWGHASNYSLTFDSSSMPAKDLASLIIGYIQKFQKF